MRRMLILCGLLALVGCRSNLVGPFQPRSPERVDDPRISIEEQTARARDRLGYPDEDRQSGPRGTFGPQSFDRPAQSPTGPVP